jgi:ATP-dependent DNA ligase
MHATELPKPFHRNGWVYEEKYDGWRMVAEKVANQVTLTSRSGLDHTRRFPELVKAVAELDASSLILDGEVAIFDRQLVSRFEWLRNRPKEDVSTPPMYMVFDLLELDGEDLRPKPLRERRRALEQLVAERQLIIPARQLPDNGLGGVGGGAALQLRWRGRQGPCVSLYAWSDALVAQGQAERLSSGGSRLQPGVTSCRNEPAHLA